MKIGDEVYVHGYVDEIRGNTVIIKNKGGCFGTCKKEIDEEFPFSQLVYPTDKFSVVVHDDKIHLINKNEVGIKVNCEPRAQTEVKVEPTWEGLTYGRFETEPQTDIGTSDTVYSDTAGYVPRADMTDCSWK